MPTKVRKFAHAFAANDGQLPALGAKKPRVGSHSGTLPLGGGKSSSKRFAPVRGGRQWTVSIAVPGSMVSKYTLRHPPPLLRSRPFARGR